MPPFVLKGKYKPTKEQQQASTLLAESVLEGQAVQTLLGVTGSGKTMTMAATVEKLQRPTLVLAHNKTLAAQLYQEFVEFFPDNAVEYFVSYYDFYRPEAYVPSSDTYIEKESKINEEIERLRHSTTAALMSRKDVLVVASVSAIYGLGNPKTYHDSRLLLKKGDEYDRGDLIRALVDMRYTRDNAVLEPGRVKARGDVVEIQPPSFDNRAYRILMDMDEIEAIQFIDTINGSVIKTLDQVSIFPATHHNPDAGKLEPAIKNILAEMETQEAKFLAENKLIEAQRIRQRTSYDMELLQEMGTCNGIENYAPVLDGRSPEDRPYCLLDYFPKDFVVFADESHQSLPQIRAMYKGDRSRKQTLIDWGFRLPSALGNRPQKWDEFLSETGPIVAVSATPQEWEREQSDTIAELIVRPTGIVDPEVEIHPTENQIDDLVEHIRSTKDLGQRTLVTTLTKKMSEDLTSYLEEMGVKAIYLHSDVKTMERVEIIRELRLGNYDVLVGVNLLREGLDIPEVGLVAILDADKEGFLRGETALIQTIGRAARNVDGRVIMYADKISKAMKLALDETDRRRTIQIQHNKDTGLSPTSINKEVGELAEFMIVAKAKSGSKKPVKVKLSLEEVHDRLVELEEEMIKASEELRFEAAASARDEIKELQKQFAKELL